ncbi:hypothetical protein GCM10022226_31400 [Sphaerisporangium flaviroseum]|uniref:Uncharacterized protein n=1 Tax=Sphaerisporangium flaviroseum TaxID=509199 RepID=A0ABP7I6Q6_9ACTN
MSLTTAQVTLFVTVWVVVGIAWLLQPGRFPGCLPKRLRSRVQDWLSDRQARAIVDRARCDHDVPPARARVGASRKS